MVFGFHWVPLPLFYDNDLYMKNAGFYTVLLWTFEFRYLSKIDHCLWIFFYRNIVSYLRNSYKGNILTRSGILFWTPSCATGNQSLTELSKLSEPDQALVLKTENLTSECQDLHWTVHQCTLLNNGKSINNSERTISHYLCRCFNIHTDALISYKEELIEAEYFS